MKSLADFNIDINKDGSIPVWAWNGYNGQHVIQLTAEEFAAIEDCEEVEAGVMVHINEYEFYGWRREVRVYTTRPGRFVPDPDDDLCGDWYFDN